MNHKPPPKLSAMFLRPDYQSDAFRRLLFSLAGDIKSTIMSTNFELIEHLMEFDDRMFTAAEMLWGMQTSFSVVEVVTLWPSRAAVPVPGSNMTVLAPLRTLEEKLRYLAAALSLVADTLRKGAARLSEASVRAFSDFLHEMADTMSRRPKRPGLYREG